MTVCQPILPEPTSYVSLSTPEPLPSPEELRQLLPVPAEVAARIARDRTEIGDILAGRSSKLLVIVGPCSVHCVAAAKEFAQRLAKLKTAIGDKIFIVMRCYFSKPRTTKGWKGLVLDPHLDGTGDVAVGLELSRRFLLEICADTGIPCASEILDLSHLYISDLLCWGAIGARTVESQMHREWASLQPFPVGFKNSTSGETRTAVEACMAASAEHVAVLPDPVRGGLARFRSPGNPLCHVVLRGGRDGPNFRNLEPLKKSLSEVPCKRILVDCSHGNSGKLHLGQLAVLEELDFSNPDSLVAGVMLEAFLEEGRQDISDSMVFGKSVTDACLSWPATEAALLRLHARLPIPLDC